MALVNLPLSRRRELLESLLGAPRDPLRLSPLLQAPSGLLEAVRKLGLVGVVGKRVDSTYEQASDQGPGSSTTRTEAGVRHWRLHSGARGFDALLVGDYGAGLFGTKPMAEILMRIDRIKIA
jgi:hypothetical protein